ncbi:MAG: exopolyphosphatase [Cyclobacteriaceae bacterium]|nr:exopolyphosphatase [Cyclobacteriaceae bacterium]
MNKVAIIDMGTNTFHLLIAGVEAGGFNIIHREKVPVKLGVGGINRNLVTDEAISRALTTMKAFKKTLDEAGVSQVLAFGTSALRNAVNGAEVTQRIESETGIKTNIISGLQEAEYICFGARAAIAMGDQKHLVMDIGGGSVEFIIANQTEIFWSHSFEIGGQRLVERFQKHDPIHPEEIEALFAYFDTALQPLLGQLKLHEPKTLVGSSGTFDTLSDIYCFRNDIPVTEAPETPFSIQAFDEIYEELLVKDRAARMQIPGMIEMRVDMIVVACCLINYLLQAYPFDSIRVSSYSLKEGVLSKLTVNS